MINIERFYEKLKEGNIKVNNTEVKELRDYLYLLAALQVENELIRRN